MKRLVYCQYGQYGLTFRALALRQRETEPTLETLNFIYLYRQYTNVYYMCTVLAAWYSNSNQNNVSLLNFPAQTMRHVYTYIHNYIHIYIYTYMHNTCIIEILRLFDRLQQIRLDHMQLRVSRPSRSISRNLMHIMYIICLFYLVPHAWSSCYSCLQSAGPVKCIDI